GPLPNRRPRPTAARWAARVGGGWIAATPIGVTSVGASTLAGLGPRTGGSDERPPGLTPDRHDCIVRDGWGDQLPAQKGSGSCRTTPQSTWPCRCALVPRTAITSGWAMTLSASGAGSSAPSTSATCSNTSTPSRGPRGFPTATPRETTRSG